MPVPQRYRCKFCNYGCLGKRLMKIHTYEEHEENVCMIVNKNPYDIPDKVEEDDKV